MLWVPVRKLHVALYTMRKLRVALYTMCKLHVYLYAMLQLTIEHLFSSFYSLNAENPVTALQAALIEKQVPKRKFVGRFYIMMQR